ncbi:MAG: BsuPI-related putative proteinase inhibitor, partial [Dehalococcoidia bacterium]
AQSSPFAVTLSLSRFVYEPGVPISFTITVRNTSSEPVTVVFLGSQRFDLTLRSEESGEVIRWSSGRSFTQEQSNQRWEPGQSRTFTETWVPLAASSPGQASAAPRPISSGVFQISAQLAGLTHKATSRPETIVIGEAVSLPAGCTTLAEGAGANVSASLLGRLIQPAVALQTVWQALPITGAYVAFSPRLPRISNLTVISQDVPVTICLTANAQITLP